MTDWQEGMASLLSSSALTAWVNDYLASWSPYEIAGLPVECRPHRLRDADDIEHWYLLLSESFCAGAALGPNADQYLKMLAFFAAAREHLQEIRSRRAAEAAIEAARSTSAG